MAGEATSKRLVVSAKPRFEVEGEERARLAIDLIRLEVSHDEDGPSRLEAVFLNWGRAEEGTAPSYLYFDGQVLDLGKHLVVRAGESDNEAVLFDGAITALGGQFPDLRPPEIVVLAEDALQRMRMRQRTRFYEQEDEAAMVSTIASDHGLSGNADAQGTQHKELWQVNQDDLGFLRERARLADARLDVSGSDLVFKPRRDQSGDDPIRLSKENELIRFEALADLAHQRTSLFVHGWSVADKEAIHESSTGDDVQAEANGGKTGPQYLDDLGWTAVDHLHLETPATTAEAQALAKSMMLRRGRRFLFGRGVTDGTPALKVGSKVELVDIGAWFSGTWSVCSVRHTFTLVEGLRTYFSAERVDIGRSA